MSAGSSEAVDERPAAIERGREASTEAKLHEWIDQGFGSALLIGATLVSLILANTAFATGWQQLFETEVGPAIWGLHMSLREWINEGVMAIFFFVVGLEIKRELVEGSLSSIRAAALPCIAAAGGMVVPIAVYLAINSVGGGVLSGWSIPMVGCIFSRFSVFLFCGLVQSIGANRAFGHASIQATDIAFAMGVFNAFKSKMPQALSAFLLTLATVDDLGAIFVIAVCFSGKISALFMGLASAATGALFLLDRMRSTNLSLYIALGSTLWYSLLRGGVNADIAGVITAFTFSTHAPAPKVSPAESEVPGKSPSLVDHLIYKMTPYTALLIMPLFALANTCVSVDGKALVSLLSTPIAMGVFCGLVLGKPIGTHLSLLRDPSFLLVWWEGLTE